MREAEVEDWDNESLARAVSHLEQITAGLVDEQRGITVLLAKLYIDVVLFERRGAGGGVLPTSVPALMLTYVRKINDTIPDAERQPPELVVPQPEVVAMVPASSRASSDADEPMTAISSALVGRESRIMARS